MYQRTRLASLQASFSLFATKGRKGVLGMTGRRAKSAPQTGKHRGTHLCSKRPKGYDRQRFGDAL